MDKMEGYYIYQGSIYRVERNPDGKLVAQKYDPKYNIWIGKHTWTGKRTFDQAILNGVCISQADAILHISKLRSIA